MGKRECVCVCVPCRREGLDSAGCGYQHLRFDSDCMCPLCTKLGRPCAVASFVYLPRSAYLTCHPSHAFVRAQGLLVTFIELIKNPRYSFWKHEFTRCAPDIERLFKSVASSCMGSGAKEGQEAGTALRSM